MLRGVNITGHNPVKMKELALLLRDAGFSDAETYIQSGNIVFTCKKNADPSYISSTIHKAIQLKFSMDISVISRTIDELKEIITKNPFLGEPDFNPSKLAVIFLTERPSDVQIQKVMTINYPPDKFIINGSEIYIYCPNGFGKTKLYTNFFEAKMAVIGTARNWRTVNTLFEMAQKKKETA